MEQGKFQVGSIISTDLTVDNADSLRDFYREVIGWQVEEMPMKDENGSYADYVMKDSEGNWAAGVCHHRGANKGLPPQWIVYINVADVAESINKCKALGGKILREAALPDGTVQYALIEDPQGAVLAITKAG